MVTAVALFRVLLYRDSCSHYYISDVCQNNRSPSLNILILMTAGLLLILRQTKVIHVQLNQLVSTTSSVFPACLYSSQQQTFLCDFQQLQSDSQTSALCEWQVLNVPAEEKPAGSWTGNKCSQRQWCSPQETAALLSVTLGPRTLSFLFILLRALGWINNDE